MSDLPSSRRLKPNASQLPVSWYFDPQIFELEQKLLFANSPGYVGHELMVPNPGDYHTFAWMDHGKVLVRNRSEEHTSELQSLRHLVCRLLLEKKNKKIKIY